ncbi:uncharacterized protein [Excalfactoria chinensis]|uniref:uncharacterized protein n=1 Tax=Excalfactoria chinensis TaxID=46218 RepID=UPI003B3A119D
MRRKASRLNEARRFHLLMSLTTRCEEVDNKLDNAFQIFSADRKSACRAVKPPPGSNEVAVGRLPVKVSSKRPKGFRQLFSTVTPSSLCFHQDAEEPVKDPVGKRLVNPRGAEVGRDVQDRRFQRQLKHRRLQGSAESSLEAPHPKGSSRHPRTRRRLSPGEPISAFNCPLSQEAFPDFQAKGIEWQPWAFFVLLSAGRREYCGRQDKHLGDVARRTRKDGEPKGAQPSAREGRRAGVTSPGVTVCVSSAAEHLDGGRVSPASRLSQRFIRSSSRSRGGIGSEQLHGARLTELVLHCVTLIRKLTWFEGTCDSYLCVRLP